MDAPAPPPGERAGDVIDRYTLIEPLGEGGMGTVWVAEQSEPVRRRVALKVIKLGMDTREVVLRFEAERQALALMDHPCIAKVLDGGATQGGRPFFVMELVDGVPITDYCDRERLDVPARLALFVRVCEAVQHAHHKGIIHRDLKPSNVLVATGDHGPVPKVIDFGIAKATDARQADATMFTELGQMLGTPEYMAPEQAMSGELDVDTRADVYSLGMLLYELLTGTKAFDVREVLRAGYLELLRQIREVEPPRPSTRVSRLGESATAVAAARLVEPRLLSRRLQGDLDWVVMRAIEKDRNRRYDTPSALAADLERVLHHEPVEAAPPSASYRLRKFVVRRKKTVAAVLTIAILLLGGIAGTSWGLLWALDEKDRADKAADVAEAEALRATAAAEDEAAARARAERISAFMVGVLQSGDASRGGRETKTILAAMDDAIAAVRSGRFADDRELEAEILLTVGSVLLRNGRGPEAAPLLAGAVKTLRARGEGPSLLLAGGLVDQANALRELGRAADAEPLFVEALAMRRAKGSTGDETEVVILDHLGMTRSDLGRSDDALATYEEALGTARRLDAIDPDVLVLCLQNHGIALMRAARNEAALARLEEAAALRRQSIDGDDLIMTLVLDAMASVRTAMGAQGEARAMREEVLAVRRRLFAGDNDLVVQALANLGDLCELSRDLAAAETHFRDALAMSGRLWPDGHRNTAFAACGLARLALQRRDLPGALEFADRSLALYRSIDAPASRELAAAHVARADALSGLGRLAEALDAGAAALEMLDRVAVPTDPVRLGVLAHLGYLGYSLGRHDLAVRHYEALVEGRAAAVGKDHPDTAFAMLNLASNLLSTERAGEALPLLEKGLANTNDPQTKATFAPMLVEAHAAAGDVDRAVALCLEQVAAARTALPPASLDLGSALAGHGETLANIGRHADAEPILREAAGIFHAQAPTHWIPWALDSQLARVLMAQGKDREAEALLLSAANALGSGIAGLPAGVQVPPLTMNHDQTLARLVALYEARGDAENAAKWRAEREKAKAR